eukprot:3276609-Rhodomonas_salina.1
MAARAILVRDCRGMSSGWCLGNLAALEHYTTGHRKEQWVVGVGHTRSAADSSDKLESELKWRSLVCAAKVERHSPIALA